jgi:acetyl-CoA decarbonylase/synthase complex subunit gamma
MVNLAKNYRAGLIVWGEDLDQLSELVQKIVALGFREIVLNLPEKGISTTLENLTQIRRLALKKRFRPLGYPVLVFTSGEDIYEHLSQAATYICKYASIVILPEGEIWEHLPLVALRQNIYTDPQKPVSVEAKLYSVGGVAQPNSPLMVTTNFSLTYFTVEPEITSSKIPSWLLVVDADGLSVLTAWAAEKFTPEGIVEAMKKENLEEKLSHRKIIIPGYVSVMSGKLNEISGWEVMVGPQEASGIPKFLKTVWKG